MKLTKVGKQAVWRSIAAASGVVLALAVGGTAVTSEWSGYINKYLGISNTKIVTDENSTEDPIHYKSDFTKYTDVMAHARDIAKQVQAEGTVLMTNKNNALPIASGSKVTFFGYNQVDLAHGGTGSGGVTSSADRKVDLIKACSNDGKLNMNKTIYDFYKEKYDAKVGFTETTGWGGTTLNFRTASKVNEINSKDFTSDVTGSFEEYKDAAVFILTRIGGEGSDPSIANKYLALTDDERSVLQTMKDGPFAKRIVLVNAFNAPELGWLDEYDIDACLYIGGPGEVGMDAVTDVIVGKTNPSGHLADTYAYDSFSSPAMQNFGDFTFVNAGDIVNTDSRKYLMYNEGIYVGYRYYETRYEDAVLNRGNASSSAGVFASENGAWKYGEEVQFSFGYGLSYSDFTQTLDSVSVNWENKTAEIKVTVSNGSDRAGKDVVQVYAQAPYTAGGIEKSAVQLCGFAKTGVINGGKSETVTVNVDLRDIASYDYETYKTYVLEQGDYYFAIGNGAHDALNNILAAKGKTVADGMDYNGNAAKAQKENKAKFNADEYKLSANKKTITNQFESTDINYYLQSNDKIKYLSRENWQETWPENMTGFSATKGMIDEAASYYSAKTDGTTSPTAYEKGSSDTSSVTLGAEQKYTLAMMIGADYDDAAWDLLLDQLTVQDYLDSTSQGRKPLKSVGLNATTAVDGPSAWTKSYYIEDYKNQYDAEKVVKTDELMVAYPTETIIASTWNVELTYELGKSFGEEGLWGGGVGWYGPGANTHRTPYGGRNFEYYSEDGFISGKLGEAECKGAMEKGTIPYFKHFFLNDQETNRIGVCTFSNEQAIREVYLRAFQYAFETTGENDKACTGVMGAFNRLGMTWTGHHKNLWKNVMEGEWGFTGNVTTDFGQKQGSLMEPQLAYEAGTHMFCTSGSGFANYLDGLDITKDLKLLTNMRESLHRQLYNFANSAAMNGLTSNSKIVTVRTWYENALLATTVISAVLLAGSGAMAVIQSFFNKKEEE